MLVATPIPPQPPNPPPPPHPIRPPPKPLSARPPLPPAPSPPLPSLLFPGVPTQRSSLFFACVGHMACTDFATSHLDSDYSSTVSGAWLCRCLIVCVFVSPTTLAPSPHHAARPSRRTPPPPPPGDQPQAFPPAGSTFTLHSSTD